MKIERSSAERNSSECHPSECNSIKCNAVEQFFLIFNSYFKKMSVITVFIIIFYKALIKFSYLFTNLEPFTGNVWDIVRPYKLFASKYMRYDNWVELHSAELRSMFFLQLFIYLLFTYLCIAWHIPLRMSFSATSNISILVNNSNSTSVFFKQACQINPGADRKWAGSSSYISMHLI